ncbi:hypothetical protein B484DRAFT_448080 [Ochromonadaceae sp. CCMP2298]|nr:hypothetical protein B484DRAFT_448080 [Ochromonadaceae sp. CCMP2298]
MLLLLLLVPLSPLFPLLPSALNASHCASCSSRACTRPMDRYCICQLSDCPPATHSARVSPTLGQREGTRCSMLTTATHSAVRHMSGHCVRQGSSMLSGPPRVYAVCASWGSWGSGSFGDQFPTLPTIPTLDPPTILDPSKLSLSLSWDSTRDRS